MSSKLATTSLEKPKTLREAIARAGLTNDQIIAKIGCSKKSLTNWRNGQRPSDYNIGLLSKVLDYDLWYIFETETNAQSTEESHFVAEINHPQVRKQLHIQTGNPKPHLDAAIKSFLANQLNHMWENFHATEETSSILTQQLALFGHLGTLESLAKLQLPQVDYQWLLCAMCEAAILIGRLSRDQLDHNTAIVHHKKAMSMAIDSASHNHIAAATMRLAESLWEAGLTFDAVSYCAAGIERSKNANPRIRGELLGFAAEVYGSVGDLKNSERYTNEAALLAVGATQHPTTGGINFSETAAASYLMDEALRRGDTQAAIAHIQRARSLLTLEFPHGHNIRWEAHLWINQARAHYEAREVEAACNDLIQAAQLAQSIDSHNALRKVQQAAGNMILNRHGQIPALQMLRENLIQISSTVTR